MLVCLCTKLYQSFMQSELVYYFYVLLLLQSQKLKRLNFENS